MNNINLFISKKLKNDEFYTLLSDIEAELFIYKKYFVNKIIYCNCDSEKSNFYIFFKKYFNELKLKKLIITGFSDKYNYIEIKKENGLIIENKKNLSDGDFKSPFYIKTIKKCDFVITNPPFSKFIDFFDLLIKYEKKFIIVAPILKVSLKKLFKLFINDYFYFGYNKIKSFLNENGELKKFGNIIWFQNIRKMQLKELEFIKYNEIKNKIFDNDGYLIINSIKNIPFNYNKKMLVPITFLNYNYKKYFKIENEKCINPFIGKKAIFKRILIKKKEKKLC